MNNLDKIKKVIDCSSKILYQKDDQILLSIICILVQGHLLIVDKPGLGKTTLIKCISKLFDLKLGRIQFTNDLLPSDIIGFNVFNKSDNSFIFQKGPIFNELILADELNRTSPKTQSSLLQAMEEKQISIENNTFDLGEHHYVFATINPIDFSGTFDLPESQLDRFLISMDMGFPEIEVERSIISNKKIIDLGLNDLEKIITKEDIQKMRLEIDQVFVSDEIVTNIQKILQLFRNYEDKNYYLSPRVGQHLYKISKCYSYLSGKEFVTLDDLIYISPFVLSHRFGALNDYKQNIELIREILVREFV